MASVDAAKVWTALLVLAVFLAGAATGAGVLHWGADAAPATAATDADAAGAGPDPRAGARPRNVQSLPARARQGPRGDVPARAPSEQMDARCSSSAPEQKARFEELKARHPPHGPGPGPGGPFGPGGPHHGPPPGGPPFGHPPDDRPARNRP